MGTELTGGGRARAGRRRTGGGSRRRLVGVVATGVVLTSAAVVPVAGAASASSGKVTYTKQTVVVPTATIKSQLLSVSASGATYTFKSSHGALAKLKAGKVMLLQDIAVRDVTKTARQHGHFVVTTTPAALTDLIANGTLKWNKSINFAKGFGVGGSAVPMEKTAHATAAAQSVAARFGMVPLSAGSGITLKGKTHSYSYSASFKKSGSAVAVVIAITKKSPVEVEASITGTLDNLTTAGDIAVDNGAMANTKMVANHLKGHFKLAYSAKALSAFGLGTAGGVKITLPAELTVPFFVAGVPLFLGIKVAFTASAGFTALHQELSGSYTFSYDGEGGFSTDSSGATSAAGVLKGLGDIIDNAKNAVNYGPVTFIFGAQMPEIDLGLGVKGLNVAGDIALYGSTGITTYGQGCDTREMEVGASAGIEASFFGFSVGPDPATLFDKKVYAAYPKGCGVFPTTDGARALATSDR